MILKILLASILVAMSNTFGEILVAGAIYFDSENTLLEVMQLSEQKDNDGLARLITHKHVSDKTTEDLKIIVLLNGPGPQSPVEFRFINGPTTYWTITKYVTGMTRTASSSPTPRPTPTGMPESISNPSPPTPTPTPEEESPPDYILSPAYNSPSPSPSPSPLSSRHVRNRELLDRPTLTPRRLHRRPRSPEDNPLDEDEYKVWHKVDGKWKWYDKRYPLRVPVQSEGS